MCVLCVVKAGHNLPSREVLMAMHRANPHGMGFASKSLHYKGMSFERFYNRLQFVPKNESIIIHFRFATHGSVGIKNCHPFYSRRIWFAHNGILDISPRGDMTDSETAFQDIFMPIIREYGLFSDELAYAVDEVIGYSKFAFLDRDSGDVRTFGHFENYKGMLCSNLIWQRYLYQQPTYSRAWYNCL